MESKKILEFLRCIIEKQKQRSPFSSPWQVTLPCQQIAQVQATLSSLPLTRWVSTSCLSYVF